MRVLAARITQLPRRGEGFLDARDDLPANRTELVGGIDKIEKVRCDAQCQLRVRELGAGNFLGGQRWHQRLEPRQRTDAVLQLPAPVVPISVGNIAPKAAASGGEFLEP